MQAYKTASVVGRLSGSFWVDTCEFNFGEARREGRLARAAAVVVVRAGEGYVNLGAFGREVVAEVKEMMAAVEVEKLGWLEERLSALADQFIEVGLELVVAGF